MYVDYDSYLASQTESYNNPQVEEVQITGDSFYKVQVQKVNGEIIELDNIPLHCEVTVNVSDEDPYSGKEYKVPFDEAMDRAKEYFDVHDIENYDTYVEKYEDKCLPQSYTLLEVIDFAEGHSFEDLEIE